MVVNLASGKHGSDKGLVEFSILAQQPQVLRLYLTDSARHASPIDAGNIAQGEYGSHDCSPVCGHGGRHSKIGRLHYLGRQIDTETRRALVDETIVSYVTLKALMVSRHGGQIRSCSTCGSLLQGHGRILQMNPFAGFVERVMMPPDDTFIEAILFPRMNPVTPLIFTGVVSIEI